MNTSYRQYLAQQYFHYCQHIAIGVCTEADNRVGFLEGEKERYMAKLQKFRSDFVSLAGRLPTLLDV